ncbi:hypothetical protein AAZX31_09G248300 [Glycine max]
MMKFKSTFFFLILFLCWIRRSQPLNLHDHGLSSFSPSPNHAFISMASLLLVAIHSKK